VKLRHLRIKNFRNLVDVEMPIDDTTVLLGENNSGKTAILDALYFVLTRARPERDSPFQPFDYYLSNEESSPRDGAGIAIDLVFREDALDEWPDDTIQYLTQIIQTEADTGLQFIHLRVTSRYDPELDDFRLSITFLNERGDELGGEGARRDNIRRLADRVRLFRLSALRNPEQEFSVNSQFWGRIVRDMKMTAELEQQLKEDLDSINTRLIASDDRLESVIDSLQNINTVMDSAVNGETSIQALPTRPWELLSRSGVVVRAAGSDVSLPLSRHGQGVQSLAVIFLFEAYISVFLNAEPEKNIFGILTLEEPEAHLHPHAARELATNLGSLQSQKLISTHSPYLVQDVPLTSLRMMRREGHSSRITYLKRSFSAALPATDDLISFCASNPTKFRYNEARGLLVALGKIEEREYRDLLQCFRDRSLHSTIRALRDESALFLDAAEVSALQIYLRTRGDALFARTWLLCEGISEYLFIRACAHHLGMSLDRTGISVVDFQNNGSLGSFVRLAKTLRIAWLGFSDDDQQRASFVAALRNAGVLNGDIYSSFPAIPTAGGELEDYLAETDFLPAYEAFLRDKGTLPAPDDPQYTSKIAQEIKRDKVPAMTFLVSWLQAGGRQAPRRVPPFFSELIEQAQALSRLTPEADTHAAE
jgi:putative ATP-dependent endonuclease of OLD family